MCIYTTKQRNIAAKKFQHFHNARINICLYFWLTVCESANMIRIQLRIHHTANAPE